MKKGQTPKSEGYPKLTRRKKKEKKAITMNVCKVSSPNKL
jgi:hypothetical protein